MDDFSKYLKRLQLRCYSKKQWRRNMFESRGTGTKPPLKWAWPQTFDRSRSSRNTLLPPNVFQILEFRNGLSCILRALFNRIYISSRVWNVKNDKKQSLICMHLLWKTGILKLQQSRLFREEASPCNFMGSLEISWDISGIFRYRAENVAMAKTAALQQTSQ